MKKLIIALALLMPACTEGPKINKDFERKEFPLVIKEYENKTQLLKGLEENGFTRSGMEKGFARWFVDAESQAPVGECTIYIIKDQPATLAHEVNHCRWGSYHD